MEGMTLERVKEKRRKVCSSGKNGIQYVEAYQRVYPQVTSEFS